MTMLSWPGQKTTDDGALQPSSSMRRRMRPVSGLYQRHAGNPSDDLTTKETSVDSVRGPITEITADRHGHTYQGVAGILCTTQVTTEIITRGPTEPHVESEEAKAYERYQWSAMN
jgi:hypothetical protein